MGLSWALAGGFPCCCRSGLPGVGYDLFGLQDSAEFYFVRQRLISYGFDGCVGFV